MDFCIFVFWEDYKYVIWISLIWDYFENIGLIINLMYEFLDIWSELRGVRVLYKVRNVL